MRGSSLQVSSPSSSVPSSRSTARRPRVARRAPAADRSRVHRSLSVAPAARPAALHVSPLLRPEVRFLPSVRTPWARIRATVKATVLAGTQGCCAYCGTALTLATVTLDHIYPQQHGGPDIVENLVAACGDCNHAKAALHPDEWFRRRPEAAMAFVLLADQVSRSYRVSAARLVAALESPYAEDARPVLPRALRHRAAELPRVLDTLLRAA